MATLISSNISKLLLLMTPPPYLSELILSWGGICGFWRESRGFYGNPGVKSFLPLLKTPALYSYTPLRKCLVITITKTARGAISSSKTPWVASSSAYGFRKTVNLRHRSGQTAAGRKMSVSLKPSHATTEPRCRASCLSIF